MAVFITEHQGMNNYRQPINQQINGPAGSYFLSSAAAGPFPQAGTKYIRVQTDSSAAYYLSLNSTSTANTLTSTNSYRLAANSPPELFSVSTAFRIQTQTTST